MKKYSYSCIYILAVFSCVLVSFSSADAPSSGNETVLLTLQGEPLYLAFDGDRVFWLRDGNDLPASERGLFCYNLADASTSALIRIGGRDERNLAGDPPSVLDIGSPAVSGDLIVFGEFGIMLMNCSSGPVLQLTNQNDSILPVSDLRRNQNPRVDSDRVVWTEHDLNQGSSLSPGNIVLRNLTSGDQNYVPVGMPGYQSMPMVSGDFILWRDYRRGGEDDADLYLFDTHSETETRLPMDGPLIGIPYLGNDTIMWTEKINGMSTIVAYSLSSGARTVVGPGSLHQGHLPPVSEGRVVWLQSENSLDFREERSAVMAKDLDTGEEIQITPFERGLSHPVISGDRVVFTRGAGDDWSREPREVVMYTLPPRTTGTGTEVNAGPGPDEHTLPTTTREGQDAEGGIAIPLPLYIPLTGICIAGLLFLRTKRW
jgi:hypothetical protein